MGFLIILLTLIVGFGFSFNALFAADRDTAPQFAFIVESLYTTYMMALFGEVDSSLYQYSAAPLIMTMMVMILQVFILIVMMNALIAIMGDTFEHMQESQEASKEKLRADMCVEFMDMMGKDEVSRIMDATKCVHVLKPQLSDDGASHGQGEWTGRMAVIRNIVNTSG